MHLQVSVLYSGDDLALDARKAMHDAKHSLILRRDPPNAEQLRQNHPLRGFVLTMVEPTGEPEAERTRIYTDCGKHFRRILRADDA